MIELKIVSKMLRDIEQACNDSNLSDWEFRVLMKNLIAGKANTHLEDIKKENKKRLGDEENKFNDDKLLYLEKKFFDSNGFKIEYVGEQTTKQKIDTVNACIKVMDKKNPRKVY